MTEQSAPSRLTFANATSILALVVALGGTADATGLIGSAGVKDNSLTGRDVKNGTLSGTDVRNKSITEADLANGVVPVPPGPGSPLPAGVTLRGVVAPVSGSASPGNTTTGQGVTFAYALSSAPAVHVIAPGAAPTATCPGTLTEPKAARGHLCVYITAEDATAEQVIVSDPLGSGGINYSLDDDTTTVHGNGRVSRFGFKFVSTDTSNVAQTEGSWAVTG